MRTLAVPLAVAALLSPIGATASAQSPERPVTVSPGLTDRFAPAGRCPTFAWVGSATTSTLELLVYEVRGRHEAGGASPAEPILRATLPAAAAAWTPPLDACLTPGRRYTWLVRRTGPHDGGRGLSEPRLFSVPAAPTAMDVRQALRVLRDYLAAVGVGQPDPAPRPPAGAEAGRGASADLAAAPATQTALEAFTAAISAEQEAGAGVAHGVAGVTHSPDGAGLAADNTAGGADLLLGAAVAGEAAQVTESTFERDSPDDLTFDFRNAGAGSMTVRVDSTDVLTATTGAAAAHEHAGEEITSGTVAEPRVHDDIARDVEVLPLMLANDGAGSFLDADLLDGSDSAAFAPAVGSASYVAKAGDTMTGTLTLSPAAGDALVTTAGDVGIGTSSPDKPLHAVGLGAIFNMPQIATPLTTPFVSIETDLYSAGAGILSVLDRRQQTVASKTPTLLVQNTHGSTDAANPLIEARAAGATRMLLQQNGNLGLHTASPGHPFHLKQFLNGAHLIAAIENTGPFSAAALKLKTPAAGNDWNLVAQETGAGVARGLEVQNASFVTPPLSIAAATGFVGISNLSPADRLDVKGDIRVGTGTTGCVKDADGTVIAGTCSSDARLKRNIAPLAAVLDRVTRLTPVTFNWRAEEFPHLGLGEATQIGLVAQQVAEVLPELVAEDEDGFLRVSYSELPLLLLQALKEQRQEAERLAALVRRLADRLAKVEGVDPSG